MPIDLRDPSHVIVVPTSSLQEEPVYDFHRKTVFSPEKGNSCSIKCCVVRGSFGSKSMVHTHPGDEIVFTLAGENLNLLQGKELRLRPGQALAVPPHTAHQTLVTDQKGWQGVTFYCDECPLLGRQSSILEGDNDALLNTLVADSNSSSCQSPGFEMTQLFSPLKKNTSFLESHLLTTQSHSTNLSLLSSGETVLYFLSGSFEINVENKVFVCHPGTAVLLPHNSHCSIQIKTHDGGSALITTCQFCPLRYN